MQQNRLHLVSLMMSQQNSCRARFALAAGRPDHYDRYHAAMRAAYAERWPLALLCRTVLVVATSC